MHDLSTLEQNSARSGYAETVDLLTTAVRERLFTPTFQDATRLLEARKGKGELYPTTKCPIDADTQVRSEHTLHLLINALLNKTFTGEGIHELISAINQRLDGELKRRQTSEPKRALKNELRPPAPTDRRRLH